MKIKFIKEHPSGFQKDAGLSTSDVHGSRLIEEKFAVEVEDKEFDELKSNSLLVANKIKGDKLKADKEAKEKAKKEEKE